MAQLSIVKNELLDLLQNQHGSAYYAAIHALEAALIEEALILCRGNQHRTALMLGICRGTLIKRIAAIKENKKAA